MSKNKNIKKYAVMAVRGNKEKTVTDTVLFWAKIVYWLVAALAIMGCLTMMMGNLVNMSEYKNAVNADELAKYHENRTQLITMIISVATLVASYFMLHFKLNILFAVTGCVDSIIIFTTLYTVSNRNEFMQGPSTAFWSLAIPAILCAVLSVSLCVINYIIYNIRVPKEYERIVSRLYSAHSKNGEVKLSPEDFEEIMNNYNGEEIFPTDRPLKKSQRKRKEKIDSAKD